MRTFSLIIILAALLAGSARAEFEAITLKNAGLERTVSGVANILKTNDVKVGDYGLLDQPTMEFMVELDYKGEKINLVPTDFDIKAIDRYSRNREDTMGVELLSHYEGLPLIVYIDYMRLPGALYQQKEISIPPCREAKGAVLKRVTVEALHFKKGVQPLSITDSGFGADARTAFAFVEPKGRGVCFDFPSAKVSATARSLSAAMKMDVPVENGWRSGRFGLSAVTGTPESAFKAYGRFLIDTRCPSLAKDPKFSALEKRFAACFAACQYIAPSSTDGSMTAVGHIADNKGFILLTNSGDTAKVELPLASSTLKLTGELKLTDWTSLDKPTDMGTKTTSDKVEIDVDENGYRIIGVNVE